MTTSDHLETLRILLRECEQASLISPNAYKIANALRAAIATLEALPATADGVRVVLTPDAEHPASGRPKRRIVFAFDDRSLSTIDELVERGAMSRDDADWMRKLADALDAARAAGRE